MLILSHESRLAAFRARLITDEGQEAEVSSRSMLAGLIDSPEVVDVCRRLSVDPRELIDDLGLVDALGRLREAEESLAAQGIAFLSQQHVDSVNGNPVRPPLSRDARRIFRELDEACSGPNDPITPVDLLFAFVSKVPEFAKTAAVRRLMGLTPSKPSVGAVE